MPQPPPYVPATNFTSYQNANPTEPLPGPGLDAELAQVQAVIAAIEANIALIQRDDGRLANNSVGPDQIFTTEIFTEQIAEELAEVENLVEVAQAAQSGAQIAQTGAETAQTAAETAATNAMTAQTGAETAEANAETAQTNAEAAVVNAENFAQAAEFSAERLNGTSTTSATLQTGPLALTTEPGKFFEVGRHLLVTSDADPENRRMSGISTAYDTLTGALTVEVDLAVGPAGPFADWTIRVDGERGPEGLEGPPGPAGAVDSTGAITAGSLVRYADGTGDLIESSAAPVTIAEGGTGATTAPNARTNLGLGNVDNTSDADKPVSTATQAALDDKEPLGRYSQSVYWHDVADGPTLNLAPSHVGALVRLDATAGPITVVLPATNATGWPEYARVDFFRLGPFDVIFSAPSATLYSPGGATQISEQFGMATAILESKSGNAWILEGRISAP